MKLEILSVFDSEFCDYGRVVTGCEALTQSLTALLPQLFPIPQGIAYEPSVPAPENSLPGKEAMNILFGGLPAQLGCCRGRNNRMNCLEYHRDSEFNLSDMEFVLLLARRSELADNTISSTAVKAFRVPSGVMVEIFSTTLHYAPLPQRYRQGLSCARSYVSRLQHGTPGTTPVGL